MKTIFRAATRAMVTVAAALMAGMRGPAGRHNRSVELPLSGNWGRGFQWLFVAEKSRTE
jgi:hypothetical protein